VKVSIEDKWFCLFVSIGKERKKEQRTKKRKKSILYKYSAPKKHINKAREHFLLDRNEPNISYKNPKKLEMKVKGP